MRHYATLQAVCFVAMASVPVTARAQNADSLRAVWNDATRPDTVRFAALQDHAISFVHGGNLDSLVRLGRQLTHFAGSKGLVRQRGKALNLTAIGFQRTGQLDSAMSCLKLAAEIFESLHDQKNLATALNNMGNTAASQGDVAQAIEYHTHSLRLNEALKDSAGIARSLCNIGVLYHMQEDYTKAMDYYQRRVVMAEAVGDLQCASEAYSNMASVQLEQGEPAEAIAGYEKSLAISRSLGDTTTVALNLVNIGRIHTQRGEHSRAQPLFVEAIAMAKRIGDITRLADAYDASAWSYLEQGDLDRALKEGRTALSLAREADEIGISTNSTELLYKAYKALGRNAEALAMHEEYMVLRDSVQRDENKQAIMQQKFQYDYDKKEALLSAEQEKKDAVAAEELRRKNLQRNAFIGGFALMILLAGVFFTQRNRISKEKRRSEELLLNILPEKVAEELKAKGSAEAVHLDQVTVLFTDFKGFTAMSEVVTPQELVRDLNECFSAFDHITAKYGIEKIKTIGDAYMGAGGLPTPNSTHAMDVIKAAFEMRDFIAEGKARKITAGLPYFEIRIGIHTGPVVAGIVGVKKFAYDIWGDTVNIASRMESSGEVGQVNISEATYALVKNEPGLSFTPRGKVQAKGKGEMEMYFVGRV